MSRPELAEPEFSVVVPTRNREALLARALASVGRQQGVDREIVVVDDGDGGGAAFASAAGLGPVTTFLTGGAGQVPARNLGVAAARGRLIAFLDDDDWWDDPFHLLGLRDALRGEGLAYASGRMVPEDETPAPPLPFAAFADARSLRTDNTLLVPGIAFPRRLHARLGGFDETLPYYWDWDWYLRIAAAGLGFFDSGRDGVRVSTRAETVSSAANTAARRADLARLCAKHGLVGVVLKNHELIAREQNGLSV